jgi:hypothetical protein
LEGNLLVYSINHIKASEKKEVYRRFDLMGKDAGKRPDKTCR